MKNSETTTPAAKYRHTITLDLDVTEVDENGFNMDFNIGHSSVGDLPPNHPARKSAENIANQLQALIRSALTAPQQQKKQKKRGSYVRR